MTIPHVKNFELTLKKPLQECDFEYRSIYNDEVEIEISSIGTKGDKLNG